MLKELQTWAKLNCFSRGKRQGARNIIYVRWVIKVKWETPTSDVNKAASGNRPVDAQEAVRTNRASLTVRGFKDSAHNDIDRYARTSSRCAQTILVSEAVRHGWPLCTVDISKAFLQGVTNEEL